MNEPKQKLLHDLAQFAVETTFLGVCYSRRFDTSIQKPTDGSQTHKTIGTPSNEDWNMSTIFSAFFAAVLRTFDLRLQQESTSCEEGVFPPAEPASSRQCGNNATRCKAQMRMGSTLKGNHHNYAVGRHSSMGPACLSVSSWRLPAACMSHRAGVWNALLLLGVVASISVWASINQNLLLGEGSLRSAQLRLLELPHLPKRRPDGVKHDSVSAGTRVGQSVTDTAAEALPKIPQVIILMADSVAQLHHWQSMLKVHVVCSHRQQDIAEFEAAVHHFVSPNAKVVITKHETNSPYSINAVDCSTKSLEQMLPGGKPVSLVFIHSGFSASPMTVKWAARALSVSRDQAAGEADESNKTQIVSFSSLSGAPFEAFHDAKPCFSSSGSRTDFSPCLAPMDATVIHSCEATLLAMATRRDFWFAAVEQILALGGMGDAASQLRQLCENSTWRALHLNLGKRTALVLPSNASTPAHVLKQWRPELDYISLHDQDVLDLSLSGRAAADAAYSPGQSGKAQLVHVMQEMMRIHQVPFVGLILSNAAFVEMTHAWLCQVRGMRGVHERTLLLCTDVECLDALRNSPIVGESVTVIGTDMAMRLAAVYAELGMPESAKDLAADLKYGTQAYHVFMLTRQLLLKQLVDNRVPYLLTETDAWWQSSAYEYLDRVLATGGKLQLYEHEGVAVNTTKLSATDGPFDMLLYVDVPSMLSGPRIGVGGGFFLVLPTAGTQRVFDKWSEDVKSSVLSSVKYGGTGANPTEQVMLQRLVAQKYKGFRPALLPSKLFPNGEFYHGLASAEAAQAKIEAEGTVVVQFNYVVGNAAKAARAKRFNHWGLDAHGGCKPLQALPLNRNATSAPP